MKTNNIFGFFALLIALLVTTTVCNAQKTVTLKHWNGNLAETTPYDAQGNLHGTQTLYNVQGIKTQQNVWQHGKLSKTTMFFKSGAIAEQTTYNDVERDQKFEYIKYDMIAGRRIKVKHQKWNPKNFDMTIMLQEYDYTTKTLNNVIGELPNGKGIYVTNNFPGYPQYKESYYDNDTAMVWMSKDKKVFYGKQPKFESMILNDTYYYIYDEAGNITYDGVAKRLEQERLARQKVIDDSLAIVRQQREAFVRDSIAKAEQAQRLKAKQAKDKATLAMLDSIKTLQDAYFTMLQNKFAGSERAFFTNMINVAKDKKLKNTPVQAATLKLLDVQDAKLLKKMKFEVTTSNSYSRYNKGAEFCILNKVVQFGVGTKDIPLVKSPIEYFISNAMLQECIDIITNDRQIGSTYRELNTDKQYHTNRRLIEQLDVKNMQFVNTLLDVANMM